MRVLFVLSIAASLWACQCGGPNLSNARPAIEARPASLDFGTTAPGVGVDRSVELSNVGVADLRISEVLIEGESAFTLFPQAVTVIKPQASVTLMLTFRPAAPGNFAARLLVRSDAQNTAELAVSLSGVAFSTDPCANVTCDQPPGPCFESTGSCVGGGCVYPPRMDGAQCSDGDPCTDPDVCQGGRCTGAPKSCQAPPAAACVDASTLESFASPGACTNGTCEYTRTTRTCSGGCNNAICLPDVCNGVTCNTPPTCFGGGACVDGSCRYLPTAGASCSDGDACTENDSCEASGACRGTPKSCQTPPASTCVDASTQRTFDAIGACAAGTCTYASNDSLCPLGCDGATGRCRSSCPMGQHACNGQCVADTSVSSCGTGCTPCPAPANGVATCDGVRCGVQCDTGYQLCNGQCLSTTSISSCGMTCQVCSAPPNGTATCNGTSCGVACGTGFHECTGQCLSNTSIDSCGGSCSPCTPPANATATCNGTSCDFTCNPGFTRCGAACCGCGLDMVQVTTPAICIDKFEASQGSGGRALSVQGGTPWVSLNTAQAQAACAAAGKRLCTETEWQAACAGTANRLYPYGSTYSGTACNGLDKGLGAIVPTGTIATCEGGYPGLFDMSGNAYERTATCTAGNCRIRGGSYRSGAAAGLLRCNTGFDFGEASPDDAVGFRCCR